MKFLRILRSVCDDPIGEDGSAMDMIDYPDGHPVTEYFKADPSVLSMTVLIEDGTTIEYTPYKEQS